MADSKRDAFLRRMIDEGTSDDDIRATLKVFDAQAPRRPVSAEEAAPSELGWPAKLGEVAGNVLKGAAKGLGSTVTGLGELASKFRSPLNPGAGSLGDAVDELYGKPRLSKSAFAAAHEDLEPIGTAQKVGKFAEQAAEVLLPGRALTAAGKGLSLAPRMALEGAANAGMSAAQGGDPLVAGAVGAVLPGAGALVGRVAPALKDSAAKQVIEALGPTKERYKAMAERLTPEILKRGLRGSREGLQEQAAEAAHTAGEQIDQAIQAFGGRPIDTSNVVDALESAKNAFRTSVRQPIREVRPTAASRIVRVEPDGTAVVAHEFEPRAIRQLDGLQSIIREMGPEVRADQLIGIRRAWDKVVDQAGGFAHRAGGAIGVPLADQSEAAAKRAATTAIREQLNASVPELTALNKEFAFWKSLDDVLSQTLKRTQPHGPGIARTAAELAGNVVGGAAGMSHGPVGAVTGGVALGKLSAMAQMAFKSPRWKLMSAGWKDDLADAIVGNDVGKIATLLGRVTAVEGSKIGR